MDIVNNIWFAIGEFFWNMNSRLALLYLASTVVIAFVIWLSKGRPVTFLKWLIPAAVYRHKSNLLDIKIFLFNSVLMLGGFFALVSFTPMVTIGLLDLFLGLSGEAYAPAEFALLRSAIATVIMILTLDFCKYWGHYIHHEHPALWPFHAVHHSAEVMTPLTVGRVHPMFRVFQTMIVALIASAVQTVILFAVMGKIDLITIGSANVGYVAFNMLGSNLCHSHIWLSYGRFWKHIFISPAQHHIHHSSDKKTLTKTTVKCLLFGIGCSARSTSTIAKST